MEKNKISEEMMKILNRSVRVLLSPLMDDLGVDTMKASYLSLTAREAVAYACKCVHALKTENDRMRKELRRLRNENETQRKIAFEFLQSLSPKEKK